LKLVPTILSYSSSSL